MLFIYGLKLQNILLLVTPLCINSENTPKWVYLRGILRLALGVILFKNGKSNINN